MKGSWPTGLAAGKGPSRYGRNAAHWQRLDEGCSLAQLMARPDYVLPGLPLLFVLAAGSSYRDRFLEEELLRG